MYTEAEDREYKWEISPHPDSSEADTLVCDDDNEAREWLLSIAEGVWDDMEPGETRTITITCNASGKNDGK